MGHECVLIHGESYVRGEVLASLAKMCCDGSPSVCVAFTGDHVSHEDVKALQPAHEVPTSTTEQGKGTPIQAETAKDGIVLAMPMAAVVQVGSRASGPMSSTTHTAPQAVAASKAQFSSALQSLLV